MRELTFTEPLCRGINMEKSSLDVIIIHSYPVETIVLTVSVLQYGVLTASVLEWEAGPPSGRSGVLGSILEKEGSIEITCPTSSSSKRTNNPTNKPINKPISKPIKRTSKSTSKPTSKPTSSEPM
jgi:hypothetical protein